MGVPMDWLANPAQKQPDIQQGIDMSQPPPAPAQAAPSPAPQQAPQQSMPADSRGVPLSPDMGGLQPALNLTQPMNAQSPEAPSPQKYGLLKRLLTGFVYNGGQAMMKNAGLPTDIELQTHQAQMQHIQAQTQQIRDAMNPVPLMDANGQPKMDYLGNPVMVPRAVALKINSAMIAAQSHVQGAQIGAQAKVDVAHINQGQGVPVDDTIANLVGMPEMSGVKAGKAAWANINSALKASGYQYKDLGQEGLWLMDRAGNRIKRISDSPSIQTATARGQAFAQAKAQWTPFETVDEDGNLTTTSAANAIQTGAPGVSKVNLANQVLKPKALIDDIHGAINQVKQYAHVFDDSVSRKQIAAALATPGITAQTFLQQPIAAGMSEDAQQEAIYLLGLKEQAMAMRSVIGMGQGSDELRRAIQQTLPGGMTPSSGYANKQLDTFTNTLDRLAKGIPQLNGAKPKFPAAVQQKVDPLGIRR